MRKLYAIKERIICILLAVVLGLFELVLWINFSNHTAMVIIAYICIVLIVVALLKLFSLPYHIIVYNNTVKVFDFPLLATNKYYEKKRSLILWNNKINISEVKSVELVKLTREQKKQSIGFAHLFDKYIKINLLNSTSSKYIYVSAYSNAQIKKIIKLLTPKAN